MRESRQRGEWKEGKSYGRDGRGRRRGRRKCTWRNEMRERGIRERWGEKKKKKIKKKKKKKNKAGYTAIRCVLARRGSSFGQKRHFCMVSTRV